jgi:hypothetical protein
MPSVVRKIKFTSIELTQSISYRRRFLPDFEAFRFAAFRFGAFRFGALRLAALRLVAITKNNFYLFFYS